MNKSSNNTFDPQTLASDLCEVQRIYANFFSGLTEGDWKRPVRRGPKEWNLHETIAHLCALTGVGLESIRYALRGETYNYAGLEDRYQFNAYNRRGIEEHISLPVKDLCAEFLNILNHTTNIAHNLDDRQAEISAEMPIYNRPVKIVEGMSIMMIHAGLFHSAQVSEPVGVEPLWKQLLPEIRHRVIGRVIRALSLLYRHDLGGGLRAVYAFRVDGPGGGSWHLDISPESTTSNEGRPDLSNLTIHMRETAVFCQIFTGRIHLLHSLLTGRLKLRGDLRLFPRMGLLFSVDARQ